MAFIVWNKITFRASNSLSFAEQVENEPMKSIFKKVYQYSLFYPIIVKIVRAYN